MQQNSLKKNFILSSLYQILLMITPFITAPYVSRVLEPDGVGIYSFTFSNQTYFAMFAALGTASYGCREIAILRDNPQKYSKVFWEIEILSMLTTAATLIAWGIMLLFVESYRLYYMILTLNIVAVALDISWFYMGLEQFQHIVYRNSLFKILSVISIFVFVRQKNDLPVYFTIMVLSTLIGNASMWTSLPHFLTKVNIKKICIKHHFKETLIYFIPTIATSIYTVLDKTLIGAITHSEIENGFYEQATKIVNMAKAVTFTSLNAILGSRISYLYAEKKYAEIRSRIEKSIEYIMFIGIGLCCGIISVAPRFVPVFFGNGYEKVIPILQLLTPVILIIGISNCLGSHYFTPAGLRKKSAKYILIGSFVNLVCNIILIPKLWSYGAVIGTLIAESTITILYFVNCNGYLTCKILLKAMWKKILSGFVMLLFILLVNTIVKSNFLALILECILGSTIYCLVLLLLKDDFFNNFILDMALKKIKSIGKRK